MGMNKLNRKFSAEDFNDPRVTLNLDQIGNTAKRIAELKDEFPFNFISSSLPSVNHPLTVDFFFVTTLQQFSFWTIQNQQYHRPLIDTISGEPLKGAFYLFMAYLTKLNSDPEYFSPKRQAEQSLDDMIELFLSDEGKHVMPAVSLHWDAAIRYVDSMREKGWAPTTIVDASNQSDYPLTTFLTMLDEIGGYCEDPLRKKSALLAMILHNRPESFLRFGETESLPPIVDYHCMRSCLRMGLIDVNDEALHTKLVTRSVVSMEEEKAVRYAAYQAVDQLADLSGRSMATVDQYFFFGRKRCPEMSEPNCSACSAEKVCKQRKELFQPVFRTDYY